MFPPFPTQEAYKLCIEIIQKIKNGTVLVKEISRQSEERKNQGVMLGVLVCEDEEKNKINLAALSGLGKNLDYVPEISSDEKKFFFVQPIVSPQKIAETLNKNDEEIHLLTKKINSLKEKQKNSSCNGEDSAELSNLKKTRSQLCNESLKKVYDLYNFHCADKKIRSLKEICKIQNNGKLPPTGTGECCEAKLLDFAFSKNFVPLSMAQIFVEKKFLKSSVLEMPELSNPCDERCGLILPEMLGLKILYRDEDIIVVDKQSGLLSVPGRGPEKQDCVVNRVKRLFPNCIEQPSVHRLDMETSGLLVLAFTKDAHRNLCRQFEEGIVKKSYIALVDGILAKKGIPAEGKNELYFRLDINNRPHQIWDSVYGKKSITEWKILDVENYTSPQKKIRPVTRVLFLPQTGRTHQLRLASSDPHGFNCPIIGDTLYGHCDEGERLMLHAQSLSFIHPRTSEQMNFFCKAPF